MKGILQLLLLYDIMCQYGVHLVERFGDSYGYLNLPSGLKIAQAIGVWHVGGHKDDCFPMFHPLFIPGVGYIDGEILETVWASLNAKFRNARSMGLGAREEFLNEAVAYNNWKKAIGMRT